MPICCHKHSKQIPPRGRGLPGETLAHCLAFAYRDGSYTRGCVSRISSVFEETRCEISRRNFYAAHSLICHSSQSVEGGERHPLLEWAVPSSVSKPHRSNVSIHLLLRTAADKAARLGSSTASARARDGRVGVECSVIWCKVVAEQSTGIYT